MDLTKLILENYTLEQLYDLVALKEEEIEKSPVDEEQEELEIRNYLLAKVVPYKIDE